MRDKSCEFSIFEKINMKNIIEAAWENRSLLEKSETQETIRAVINQLDSGELRVASPTERGWQVNEWVKKAVVLYFPIQQMETLEAGPMEFHDKMPLKKGIKKKGFAWYHTLSHVTALTSPKGLS